RSGRGAGHRALIRAPEPRSRHRRRPWGRRFSWYTARPFLSADRAMTSLDQALRAAFDARRELLAELHSQHTDCYRLFHGSQEGAPGLTVDRYGPQLLVQSFHTPLQREALLVCITRSKAGWSNRC